MPRTIMDIEKTVTATMLAAGEHALNQCANEGLSWKSPHGLRRIYAEMEQDRQRAEELNGMAIHHIDGNPHNNTPANLRLVPIKENRG